MIEKVILVDKKNIPTLKKDYIVINKMEIKDKDNILIKVLFHGGCKDLLLQSFYNCHHLNRVLKEDLKFLYFQKNQII